MQNEPHTEEALPSHKFAETVHNFVSKRELESCLSMQHEIHKKTKESHQALQSFNAFSSKEFAKIAPELERKTKLIQLLKKDLYNIFDRISELRESIGYRFPDQEVILPEELEEEQDDLITPTKAEETSAARVQEENINDIGSANEGENPSNAILELPREETEPVNEVVEIQCKDEVEREAESGVECQEVEQESLERETPNEPVENEKVEREGEEDQNE